MSKQRFAASLMELANGLWFGFLKQYSVADLHEHDFFAGEIFLSSP